jgi:hypothetical protein
MGNNISSSKPKCKNKSKKRNGEIIARREKSCDPIGKQKIILPHKFDEFQVELYRPIRSETESEDSEILSDSPKKWSNFMKKQTSNLKEITTVYFALHHFLPIIKKYRYKNILIWTDNTATMYNINKKSGAMNLYCTARKIWKLSEINYLILKAREDKCDNQQTESIRNEQRLSIKGGSLFFHII